jgi:ribosome-associated toxin RatA of RatAB toxin-antitoxin module
MLVATADIDVECSPAMAAAVLWDVVSYPDFLSDVLEVEVADQPEVREATFHVRVFRARQFRVALQRQVDHGLRWTLIDGEHLRSLVGSWQVVELAPGLTRLTYALEIDLDFAIPDAIARRFLDFGLPTVLRQFKARMETTAALAELTL